MNPSNYPWLESAWAQFKQFDGRMPHALLLAGPSGVGKTALGMAMTQSLLCETPESEVLFKSGNHPDIHLISTEAEAATHQGVFDQYATRYLAADAKTASRKPRRIISVDQIRRLIEKFSLSQHTSNRKVALIMPAEAMNMNSANALLKLLEEPPSDSVLILCANDISRLPVTIVSRCVRLSVPIPERLVALDWLEGKVPNAEEALTLSGGAPLSALAYSDGQGLAQFQVVLAGLQALLEKKIDPIVVAEQLQKLEMTSTLNRMQKVFAALLSIRLAQSSSVDEDANGNAWLIQQMQGLIAAAKHWRTESICRSYDTICELKRHDVAQLNPQMLFEQITFEINASLS